MKLRTTLLGTYSVLLAGFLLVGNTPVEAAEAGGNGWCSQYVNSEDYWEHNFLAAHNLTCRTDPHPGTIPGQCTQGLVHLLLPSTSC
jgi:hypothetical protein